MMKYVSKRDYNKFVEGVQYLIPLDSKKFIFYYIDYNGKDGHVRFIE